MTVRGPGFRRGLTHIQHVLSKLGVHTRAQAVAMAFQKGLVEPDVQAHALALLASTD